MEHSFKLLVIKRGAKTAGLTVYVYSKHIYKSLMSKATDK